MKGKTMIVKIQKPLVGPPEALVYSQDRRTISRMIPMAELPATIRAALGERVRVFWHANVGDGGTLVFGAAASQQGW
jgi:hypothetical protein